MDRRNILRIAFFALAGSLVAPDWSLSQTQSATPSEADRITEALTPRRTRGLAVAPADTKSIEAVDRLKGVRKTRGLSHREQDELHVATQAMPQTDLEIFFAFNSAVVDPKSIATLAALGEALNRDALKGSTIVLGGHTDRKGTPDYNQLLSDRRAQAVAQYLAQNHKVDPARILATGYGFRKLKLPDQPFADANRRVQIVNATK
jgi:outer membrane protein OmpA-like peptidoglycan-associated protein